jgi:CheY-like chemotaxis protein
LSDLREHPRGGWILVAEDDDDTRAEVRAALEEQGYRVAEARNGREALDVVFGPDPPDVRLVITDIYMPEVSGFELLNILSAYYRPSRIPFVVVSVSPRRRSQPGVVGWLEKPFDIDALLALVRPHVLPATPEA